MVPLSLEGRGRVKGGGAKLVRFGEPKGGEERQGFEQDGGSSRDGGWSPVVRRFRLPDVKRLTYIHPRRKLTFDFHLFFLNS